MDLLDPNIWASLLALTVMEIILGIDNIVFISVLVDRLDGRSARYARQIGLGLALLFRIMLLLILGSLIGLTTTLFQFAGIDFSWRSFILLAGGAFLLIKGTHEIHKAIEGQQQSSNRPAPASFLAVIIQIVIIDIVFSVDSIITAIGMTPHIWIMITAVTIAVGVMYVASVPLAAFIRRHPTTKMLALSFLLLIGVALIADGLGTHIPKGYIYVAMGFSAAVEIFNFLARHGRKTPETTR